MTKLLLLSSHAVLEFDDIRLFSDLGIDVFCPGGYENPRQPSEGSDYPEDAAVRPMIPNAPYHPELVELCHHQRFTKHAGQEAGYGVWDWAKADLHPELIEWADVVMVNCMPVEWLFSQWERIRHKRVIWRTIGQSNAWIENQMRLLRPQGLEVVRYSPAERRHFEPLGQWAGEDAVIRFAKYPSDFAPWIGDDLVVGNVTQDIDRRADACQYGFWQAATQGLPTKMAGFGSERVGGLGRLSYPALLDYLRHLRAFLYLGTQPASYTLGLMEAMLAGVPIVSVGPRAMDAPALFEAHELTERWSNHPRVARDELEWLLKDDNAAAEASAEMHRRGVELFGAEAIGAQWCAYLGVPVRQLERVA